LQTPNGMLLVLVYVDDLLVAAESPQEGESFLQQLQKIWRIKLTGRIPALEDLADRAMFQQPANYFSDAALQEHWRDLDFPSRKLRRRPTQVDLAEFKARKADLRRTAAAQEQLTPVSFALENSWTETVQDDKTFYHNNTVLRMT